MARLHTIKNKHSSYSLRHRRNTSKTNKRHNKKGPSSCEIHGQMPSDLYLEPVTSQSIIRQIQERTSKIRLPEHVSEDEWVKRMSRARH